MSLGKLIFDMTAKLSICHLNVRSLVPHFNDFLEITKNYDVIAVTESWLSHDINSSTINIPHYVLHRVDRMNRRGGGLCMYVSNRISSNLVSSSVTESCEYMLIKFKIKKRVLAVYNVYRPPRGNFSDYIETMENSLTQTIPTVDDIVCVGDMNIDLMKVDNALTKFFESLNFAQIIDGPTRVTNKSMTLLDPIFISNRELVFKSDIVDSHISDHSMVTCSLHFNMPQDPVKMLTIRDFKNFNYDAFHEDLLQAPFFHILRFNSIEEKVMYFSNLLISIFDCHAPVRRIRVSKPPAPWLTYAIKILIREKDTALRKYRRTKTPIDWENYKNLRNFTLASIRREKKAYYNSLFQSRNSKSLWKGLQTFSKGKINTDIPINLQDPENINKYFSTVFVDREPDDNLLLSYNQRLYPGLNNGQFSFRFLDVNDTTRLLHTIKSNAYGSDKISICMLRYCSPYLDPYITHIINSCLEYNYYPQHWKESIIRPIAKISNPKEFSDLRPVSILPAISKILEKAVHLQITKYLDEFNILSDFQAGFRAGYSTSSALVNVTNDVVESMDNKELTALVALDFSKAFDTINHKLMYAILSFYGFSNSAADFINSYLTGRKQKVSIDDRTSTTKDISSGVPQGSILGPLLFILYINELFNSITYCRIQTYADDTQLYLNFKPDETRDAENKINFDLDKISKFSASHNLKLNPNKSYLIVFGNRHLRQNFDGNLNIHIENTNLDIVNSIKNLGVFFDSGLKFDSHVNHLIKGSFSVLKLLYSNRHVLSGPIKKLLTESLILSRFNYGTCVYGPFLDTIQQNRVQKVQNYCARFIFNLRKYDHISAKITELNWLTMEKRRKVHFSCFVYNIFKSEKPKTLFDKMTQRSSLHGAQIRSRRHMHIPRHKTAFFQKSFSYCAPKIFNSHVINFLDLPFSSFKYKMKKYIKEEKSRA